jgi:F-type H+-transporting ATPase subunit epsilon
MSLTFKLSIASKDELIYSGDVVYAGIPTDSGGIGVYANHTALLSSLKSGVFSYTTEDNKKDVIYVSGGVVEILNNTVKVIIDDMLRSNELDKEIVLADKKETEEYLKKLDLGSKEYKAVSEKLDGHSAKLELIRVSESL